LDQKPWESEEKSGREGHLDVGEEGFDRGGEDEAVDRRPDKPSEDLFRVGIGEHRGGEPARQTVDEPPA